MTRILTFAILAVIVIGAVRIVTLSSAQPTSEATVDMIARTQQGNPGILMLNTVTLGNDDVPVSEHLEPILIYGINGTRLTVFKRQDGIFHNGFEVTP